MIKTNDCKETPCFGKKEETTLIQATVVKAALNMPSRGVKRIQFPWLISLVLFLISLAQIKQLLLTLSLLGCSLDNLVNG